MAHQRLHCSCSSVRLLISPWLFSLLLPCFLSIFAPASCPAFHASPHPSVCHAVSADQVALVPIWQALLMQLFKSKHEAGAARLTAVVTRWLQLEFPVVVVVISFLVGDLQVEAFLWSIILSSDDYHQTTGLRTKNKKTRIPTFAAEPPCHSWGPLQLYLV